MTKQLYEEALADVKKLKEVAEANATRALLDAVTPRIKELIENQLLGESSEVEEEEADPDEVLTDKKVDGEEKNESDDKVDEEDDVTEGDVYELNSESVKALGSLVENNRVQKVGFKIKNLGDQVRRLKSASPIIQESSGYADAIRSVISDVEDTYSQIQENLDGSSSKKDLEAVLEGYYQTLKQLTERKMNRKNRLNEADITLKLGGIPDELQDKLEDLDVTIVSGGDEEGGDEGGEEEGGDELDLGDEGGDEGGEEEGGDELDLGDEEGGEEAESGKKQESRRLSDNLVVEIDEGMLRREISRMKMLREQSSKPPQIKGLKAHGAGKVAAGFEDDDLGDPFVDIDLRESDMEEVDQVDQMDKMDQMDELDQTDPVEEMDQMDELDQTDPVEEMDQMDQAEDTAQYGGVRDEAQTNKQSRQPGQTVESIRRRLAAEARLQMEAKRKAQGAKKKAQQAEQQKRQAKTQQKKQQATKQTQQMKEAYAFYATRYNESVARSRRLKNMLSEAVRRGRTLNGAPARSAAETSNLRNKLAETNLFNAKLLFTNKLLQNETLTKRQKAEVIERLDEARSEREVKLVYESLVKTLAGSNNRSLTESVNRGVIGSSSRPARPAAAASLNEGFEADRWAKLAGIVK